MGNLDLSDLTVHDLEVDRADSTASNGTSGIDYFDCYQCCAYEPVSSE